MQMGQLVTEVKQHFEQGAQLVASHVEPLLEWAVRADSDPLVGAALQTTLGPTGKAIVVELIGRLEALAVEAEQAKQQAAADAVAAAQAPPPDPAAAEQSAA